LTTAGQLVGCLGEGGLPLQAGPCFRAGRPIGQTMGLAQSQTAVKILMTERT